MLKLKWNRGPSDNPKEYKKRFKLRNQAINRLLGTGIGNHDLRSVQDKLKAQRRIMTLEEIKKEIKRLMNTSGSSGSKLPFAQAKNGHRRRAGNDDVNTRTQYRQGGDATPAETLWIKQKFYPLLREVGCYIA